MSIDFQVLGLGDDGGKLSVTDKLCVCESRMSEIDIVDMRGD